MFRPPTEHFHDHGYAHQIERLTVLGNLPLTAGVDPWAMTTWMWASFVDRAEWVMLPKVVGMALHDNAPHEEPLALCAWRV